MAGIIVAPLAVGEDFDSLDGEDNEEGVVTVDNKFDYANSETGINHTTGSTINSASPDAGCFDNSDWFTVEFLSGCDGGVNSDSQHETSNNTNCAKSKKDESNNNCVKGNNAENEKTCPPVMPVISNSSDVFKQVIPSPTNSGSHKLCTHSRSASNPVQTSTNHEFFPPSFKRTNSSSSSDFCSSPTTSICESITSPTRTSQAVLRGRQARWEMQSANKPIARPRSTTPISIATYDDYLLIESKKVNRKDSLSPVNKLKIVLPGEEFEPRVRSPRKSPKKPPGETLWSNFDETGLFSRSAIISDRDVTSPLKSPKRVLMPSSLPTSPGGRRSSATSPNNWIVFSDDDEPVSANSSSTALSGLPIHSHHPNDSSPLTPPTLPPSPWSLE